MITHQQQLEFNSSQCCLQSSFVIIHTPAPPICQHLEYSLLTAVQFSELLRFNKMHMGVAMLVATHFKDTPFFDYDGSMTYLPSLQWRICYAPPSPSR